MAEDTDAGGGRPGGDPAALRAGYEQLRERVLAGRPDGWRLGHAALAQGGIAGWIAASAAVLAHGPTRSRPGPIADRAVAAPAAEPAGEIVAVLCEMTLAHAA